MVQVGQDERETKQKKMPFRKKISPVVFVTPVILMEVLNVVVDQNWTFNPDKIICYNTIFVPYALIDRLAFEHGGTHGNVFASSLHLSHFSS